MASSFGGSCLLRNDGGGVVMSMGTLRRTSEWMRRKVQAWDQTSARFLLHGYISEYFLPSIYPSSPKYKISELLLAWENAQREHEWHSCFSPDMRFVCRFNHSVDHLQLPALRSSDVKNMSSLQALNSSPTLWLMPEATAVPLLIGLKLEVILDWGLQHWHSAPAPLLTLMFPYNFMDQTGRLAAEEWAEKVERFGSAHQQQEMRQEDTNCACTSAHVPIMSVWTYKSYLGCVRPAASEAKIKV